MKKFNLIHSCALLAVAIGTLLLISCDKPKSPAFKIVKMTGGSSYINFSNFDQNPYGNSSYITNYEDSIHAKILQEGDILLISFIESDNNYYYRYSFSDGEFLAFSEENSDLIVNGKLKSIPVGDEDINPDKFNALNDEIIKNIQSVILPDSVSPQYMPNLKRIAALNPNAGIITERYFEGIESGISLLDPEWIVCEKLNFKISGMDNLKQIFITGGSNDDFYKLSSLPKLQRIIIWLDALFEVGNIPVNTNLKSLTFFGPMNDLSFVKKFPNLEELNISNDCTHIDIGPLAHLKNLRILNLFAESVTTGLVALDDLASLEWMTFPLNISNDDFRSFIEKHTKLKVVGVVNDEWIVDLQPLQSLNSLTCLSIYGDTVDIESLYGFKQLEYLGIPQEILYDSTTFTQLKAKLSETVIVPDDIGLCLGTGWLLLFFPFMAFIYMVFSHFRKKV